MGHEGYLSLFVFILFMSKEWTIAILLEPTVPLFFQLEETILNISHNLPATILAKMIPLYQYIHIRQRRTCLQHQYPLQDFLFYGSMSDVDNCWKISDWKRRERWNHHIDTIPSCCISTILACTRIGSLQAYSWAIKHLQTKASRLCQGKTSPPFFWAQAVRHITPTAIKNIIFFIFLLWSVSSHGSGLCQDLSNKWLLFSCL